jgi:hypothetical protein
MVVQEVVVVIFNHLVLLVVLVLSVKEMMVEMVLVI